MFTRSEVKQTLANLDCIHDLIVSFLYSTSICLMEGLRLRVKDIDFEDCQITEPVPVSLMLIFHQNFGNPAVKSSVALNDKAGNLGDANRSSSVYTLS